MPQVVLIAVDGVRPEEVFEGVDAVLAGERNLPAAERVSAERLMPNLHRLARSRGTLVGAPNGHDPIWATGPNFVSLPGYREMLSGRSPGDCQKNDCEPIAIETLADAFRNVSAGPREVAVISSWEGIERAASRDPSTIVTSCGRYRGTNRALLAPDARSADTLRAGEEAAPAPGTGEFRPDALTARIALDYLQRERPRFLFVGLGEPDEYAHENDYAGYLRSLHAADRVLGEVDDLLERTHAWERDAIVFVTTDHGRGADFRVHGGDVPESGRVWLLALGRRVAKKTFAPTWRPFHLADIAPTIRYLAGIPTASGEGGAPMASLISPGRGGGRY